MTTNELIEALEKAGDWRQNQKKTYVGHAETVVKKEKKENPILKLEHIEYVYSSGTAYEKRALKDINLDIYEGEFVGGNRAYRLWKIDDDPAFEWTDESDKRSALL